MTQGHLLFDQKMAMVTRDRSVLFFDSNKF